MNASSSTATKSCLTSYHALFSRSIPGAPTVKHIEIPLIQRDYAQGRQGADVERIRDGFLKVLHSSLSGGKPVCLDFVYGDVTDGTLRPLDGQQRLTTLFLLHWYLACGAGCLEHEQDWKNFTYATRPSARLFCECLVGHALPAGTAKVSAWIEDQPWYLWTWRHDPTIQSMLVMLDAIQAVFQDVDASTGWQRLIDHAAPAISFHLLPIERMGLSEDLYIKMNSRGKPLTPFENFKASFEQTLEQSCPERLNEFALRVDGEWADILWPLAGSEHLVDDEFLRYFQFVTEICEWREGGSGQLVVPDILLLAEKLHGPQNLKAKEHLDFLFRAFDVWYERDIAAEFDRWFAGAPASLESGNTSKVVIFDERDGSLNLFAQCCASYGTMRSADTRNFGWGSILLLHAVVLHYIHETAEFPCRLRILRNLIEASSSELRLGRMPGLVNDVYRLVVEGTLEGVAAFNQAQVEDERKKAALLTQAPWIERALFQLEDHRLLRGRLFAFELDADVFSRRAEAFHQVFAPGADWLLLTGALLATGDYSREPISRFFQFGAAGNELPWRRVLAEGSRPDLARPREVLGRFLDEVSNAGSPRSLEEITKAWLTECEQEQALDWRYYFVKYPSMREGDSGRYASRTWRLDYDVCMLKGSQMKGYYRDPYLLAIYRESGVATAVQDPWFFGYEDKPRLMRLEKSGTEIQCVPTGLLVRPPANPVNAAALASVYATHGIGSDGLLTVPQSEKNGRIVDTQDRIQIGAQLLRDLVAAGL